MPPPKPRHGQICVNICFQLKKFTEQQKNRTRRSQRLGVITEQSPDTVRGMDVAFISYSKIPAGPLPETYFDVPPDAIFEVRSPSDRWTEILRKVTEYLLLGVPAVYVLDPETSRVHCYFADRPETILDVDDEFVGIGPLAGFRVPVAKFFE